MIVSFCQTYAASVLPSTDGHVHSTWPRAWLQHDTQSPAVNDDAMLTAGSISVQLPPLRDAILTKSWPVQTTFSSSPFGS